jgi:hypothetical protein
VGLLGTTSLTNMVLLCRFHYLIMTHEQGWSIALHPDGHHHHDQPGREAPVPQPRATAA